MIHTTICKDLQITLDQMEFASIWDQIKTKIYNSTDEVLELRNKENVGIDFRNMIRR